MMLDLGLFVLLYMCSTVFIVFVLLSSKSSMVYHISLSLRVDIMYTSHLQLRLPALS